MVLLIPDAVRKIKEQGRKEGIAVGEVRGRKVGHEEGNKEGRASERQRIADALAQLGAHEGNEGEAMLSRAEVLKILHGDDGEDA